MLTAAIRATRALGSGVKIWSNDSGRKFENIQQYIILIQSRSHHHDLQVKYIAIYLHRVDVFWVSENRFIFRKISLNVKQTASENPLSSEERTWNLLHKSFLGKRAQIIILMWIPLIRQLWRGGSSCSLDEQLQPIFLFCGSHDFGWIFCSNQV